MLVILRVVPCCPVTDVNPVFFRSCLPMSNIVVDDTDPILTYLGDWTLFAGGSSRQWNSTIHSTFQTGATVSFEFLGSACKVYGTVPPGNGSTILMDVTIDGSVSPIVTRTSNSTADYANLFYQSGTMESTTWHTVIITNRGGAGNLDLEFDRVELDANDIVPTIAAFAPGSATSTATPSALPSVLTQIVTTTRQDGTVTTSTSEVTLFPDATSQASSSSAHTVPVKTIVGIVGGIIALLVLLLFLLLCRRRRRANNYRFALMKVSSDNTMQNMSQYDTTVATPFTLEPSSSSSADSNAALDSHSRLLTAMSGNQHCSTDRPLKAASIPTLLSSNATVSDPDALPGALNESNNNAQLSASIAITSPSTRGTVATSMYDVPPAYRPN